jgi:hypothetical protein
MCLVRMDHQRPDALITRRIFVCRNPCAAYGIGLNVDTSSPTGHAFVHVCLRWLTYLLSVACEFLFPRVNMEVANATNKVIGCELDDPKAPTKTTLSNPASVTDVRSAGVIFAVSTTDSKPPSLIPPAVPAPRTSEKLRTNYGTGQFLA